MAHIGQKLTLGECGPFCVQGQSVGSRVSFSSWRLLPVMFVGPAFAGDIPIGADDVGRFPGGIPIDECEGADMVDAPSGQMTRNSLLNSFSPRMAGGFVFIHSLAIFWVQSRQPCLIGTAKPILLDAVEAEHLLVPHKHVVDKIVSPKYLRRLRV